MIKGRTENMYGEAWSCIQIVELSFDSWSNPKGEIQEKLYLLSYKYYIYGVVLQLNVFSIFFL